MSIAALIRSMADAGAPPEAIALAVEAIEAADARVEGVRAAARERKRRQRERDGTVTGQSRDTAGTVTTSAPSPSPSPPDPPYPAPIHGEIYIPRAKAGPPNAEIAKGFLAFWAAYPRRVGKDAAAKAFTKAMRRIESAEPLAVILAGIERALPGWDDPAFIPHPATWLNAGRWEDDAPQPRTGLTRNDRPDKLAARHDNYAASWSGSERAAELMAARRTF